MKNGKIKMSKDKSVESTERGMSVQEYIIKVLHPKYPHLSNKALFELARINNK